MANYREMSRLAQDDAAVRRLASSLLCRPDSGWTDWEQDFLEAMARFDGQVPISTRQREKLTELRDSSEHVTTIGGLSVQKAIETIYRAKSDLPFVEEEDQISELHKRRPSSVSKGVARRLRCWLKEIGLGDVG